MAAAAHYVCTVTAVCLQCSLLACFRLRLACTAQDRQVYYTVLALFYVPTYYLGLSLTTMWTHLPVYLIIVGLDFFKCSKSTHYTELGI